MPFQIIRNDITKVEADAIVTYAGAVDRSIYLAAGAEAEGLYEAAGYVLTETNKFDLCVRYFLNTRKYNIVEDNIILDEYGLPLMGARA